MKPRSPALRTGDNGPPPDERAVSLVNRIVALEEERRGIASDIKDIYAEGKSSGIDPPGLRLAVKRTLETTEKRQKREAAEEQAEIILRALGQMIGTPLADAAVERAAH